MLAQIKNLNKQIPDGKFKRLLFSEINFEIEENETIALVGTSGSGKTGLLRALSGLEVVYEGDYMLNGVQMVNLAESGLANMRRQYMGFIGFEPEFIESMSVRECLSMPLQALSIPYREQKNRMLDILEIIGLVSKLNTPIATLQYYEKMYIAAARAFIKKPLLVVADDPCKQLHSTEALAYLDLIRAVSKEFGGAFIFSTYDPAHLKKVQRIIYMKNGKIIKMENVQ